MKHLNDPIFLNLFDNEKIKAQYVSILILNFDEKPIREIQGTISAGTITVNGGSAVRRTANLTMNATEDTNKLTNLNNIISINKKVKIAVGYKNYFSAYKEYGDIIWFPCGLFVIEKASLAKNATGYSITINGKDKMALLDGTIGGMIPASTTFHEREEILENGERIISKPTIYQIIQEAVNHFGKEPLSNIEINDLDQVAKMLVRWQGDVSLWLDEESGNIKIQDTEPSLEETSKLTKWNEYQKGTDVGYLETPMTYPGDLILNAGDTVVTLLDKINTTLGKIYEYFYDLNGKFIFQKIKDYSTHSYTPLVDLNGEKYMKSFNESKYSYSFTNANTITSINYNPAYEKIKNDFIVWGQRQTPTGEKIAVRYHLAIDEKPQLDICKQYMWAKIQQNRVIEYVIKPDFNVPKEENYEFKLIGKPALEWREELYRRALLSQVDATAEASHYDQELLVEWRKLYDPTNEEWSKQTGNRQNWNPEIFDNPASLNYWLDFIDSGSKLGEFSVSKIGRRSIIQKNDKIASVYSKPVQDIIFISIENQEELIKKREYYQSIGQRFCQVTPEQLNLFSISATGMSAFDQIRELLYQHLVYNISANITCIPRYYFEPNTLIYIRDQDTGIEGNFVMKQFTLPLTYNGTMSITANEALVRI